MSGITELLAGAGVGLVGGLTSGFMGTSPGGGLVIFCVLLLGAEQHVAQGTSLIAQVPPTGLAGVRRYWQSGNRSPLQWIVWIGIGFLVGGAGGGYAAAAVSDAVLQWTYVVYLALLIAALLLRRDRKDGAGEAGEVEAFVGGYHAAFEELGVDAGAVDGGDFEADFSVVDEDAFAGGDVCGEAGVGGAAEVAVALGVFFHGDGEGVAAFKEYGAFGEVAESDLRALKVGEDADAAAGLVGGLADALVALLVFGVGAVAEVESGDVHSGFDQGFDLVVRVGGGAQGADDFRSAHVSSLCLTGG